MSTPPDDPQILRLDPETQRRVVRLNVTAFWSFAVIAVLALVVLTWLAGMPWIGLATTAVIVVLGVVTTFRARRLVRAACVVLDDGTYTVRWTRTVRFTAAEADRVVTLDDMALASPRNACRHLIVTGPTKRLAHLVGQMWSDEQLTTIATDLAAHGVPLTQIQDTVTPAQLRAYDKRLITSRQANPGGYALLTALGTVVLFVVVLVVVIAVAS